MKKPDSLRKAFTDAFPDLKENPDRFRLWIEEGNVRSHAADPTQTDNLDFSLEYKLVVVFDGWRRSSLLIWIYLLRWLRQHQPDLLTPGQSEDALPFESDILSSEEADISFDLKLREPVKVTRREDGGLDMQVVEEPVALLPDTLPMVEDGEPLKSIWVDGVKLV